MKQEEGDGVNKEMKRGGGGEPPSKVMKALEDCSLGAKSNLV